MSRPPVLIRAATQQSLTAVPLDAYCTVKVKSGVASLFGAMVEQSQWPQPRPASANFKIVAVFFFLLPFYFYGNLKYVVR